MFFHCQSGKEANRQQGKIGLVEVLQAIEDHFLPRAQMRVKQNGVDVFPPSDLVFSTVLVVHDICELANTGLTHGAVIICFKEEKVVS